MPRNFARDEAHGHWKGDAAGYRAKHTWIASRFGKPSLCEHCGATDKARYHWANISGKYLRVRSDWKRLCVSCHVLFDRSAIKNRPTYSFGGETMRLAEWAQKLGVAKCTLTARFRRGWPLERVLSTEKCYG